MLNFDNSYAKLPPDFYAKVSPANFPRPELIAFNQALARELGINFSDQPDSITRFFSGNEFPSGSEPLAMVYAGHQFGHFVPRLGDGRAMLLGEVISKSGKRYDLHLKGAGRTAYSRNGDGRSAIGPVVREYLVSEAMHALGTPTTRSLCAVRTGETVLREDELPGAVLVRVALSHIRVGTFEYFARRGDRTNLKILADYAISRLYPGLEDSYFEFWKAVAQRQVELVVKWMSLGFIHGVMNTDNMAISGETIDYGPCAFMDEFKMGKVFSSIDQYGRYAYGNQPQIALWNLTRLAECMMFLTEGPETPYVQELEQLKLQFATEFSRAMGVKLGLKDADVEGQELLSIWFELLEREELDFTLAHVDLERIFQEKKTFIGLEEVPGCKEFLSRLVKRLEADGGIQEAVERMRVVNPQTIPRNHRIALAIEAAQKGDDKEFKQLLEILKRPFERNEDLSEYELPPRPSERVTRTFCGT